MNSLDVDLFALGGRKIQKPRFKIPWAVLWLHHEMVLQLAQGRTDSSRQTLFRSLPYCVFC